MLSRIHFLHEILLNLLISCRKNKVSYHVFLLLLLVHEVYIENQEPRIEKSDWSIQISYALKCMHAYSMCAESCSHVYNLVTQGHSVTCLVLIDTCIIQLASKTSEKGPLNKGQVSTMETLYSPE